MLYFLIIAASCCLNSASAFSLPLKHSNLRTATFKASEVSGEGAISRRDAVLNTVFASGGLMPIMIKPEISNAAMIANEDLKDNVVCVSSYRTPSYSKWRSEIGKPLIAKGKLAPPGVKVFRQIFAKSTSPPGEEQLGKDIVHSITVFPKNDLAAMASYYNEAGDFCTRGRREGWLTGPFDCNYFKSAAFLNARKVGAPAKIEKGAAFVYGGHGIDVPFDEWKSVFESPESIAFLEDFGISGVSYGPSLPKVSNIITTENGVGIIDYFSTFADAKRFTDILSSKTTLYTGMTLAKGEEYFRKPLYLTAGQITDDFIYPKA